MSSFSGICGALSADTAQPVSEGSARSSRLGTQLFGPCSYRPFNLWQCQWSQAAAISEHIAGKFASCCLQGSTQASQIHVFEAGWAVCMIAE